MTKPIPSRPADDPDLSVAQLAKRCAAAMSRFRRRQEYLPDACYELFRRALELQDQEAWQAIYTQYHRLVRHWLGDAPGDPDALVNQVFGRFWQALTPGRFADFPSLDALLEYLKRCAQTVALRAERQAERQQIQEDVARTLYELGYLSTPSAWSEQVLERITGRCFYTQVMDCLTDPIERLVFRASFEWDMKPRTIAAHWPHLFTNGRHVSRVKGRILRRLRRDRELLNPLKISNSDGGKS